MASVDHPPPGGKKDDFSKQIKEILDNLGVDTVSKFQKILRNTKWSKFAEERFPHPDDISKPLELHDWQKRIIDKIQEIFYNPDSDEHNQYMQVIAPRSRGKSVLIGVANAIILIVTGGAMTGIFSPSMQQSENLMSKTKYFIENSKYGEWILPRGKHIAGMTKIFTGAQSVGLTNRSFSQAYANNEKTMRGIHLRAAFVDESARMSSHTMQAAIYPMVRRSKGPLVCITTPFGRTGPAWEAYNKPEVWDTIMIPATDTDFMTPEELEQELQKYDDPALARQELMAEFISDENAIFKDWYFNWYYREDYNNMASYYPTEDNDSWEENFQYAKYDPEKTYHMSADYGWASNRAAVAIGYEDVRIYRDENGVETSREEFIKVVYFRSWLSPDPDYLEDEFIRLMKFFHIDMFVPDGLSVGTSELIRLSKRIRKEKMRTVIFKTGDKPKSGPDKRKLGLITTSGHGIYSKLNIVNETIRASNKKYIRLPSNALLKEDGEDCYELEKEMRAFAKDVTKAGNLIWGRGVSDEPDDRVLTLMYLVFSFTAVVKRQLRVTVAGSSRDNNTSRNIAEQVEKTRETRAKAFGGGAQVLKSHARHKKRKERRWGR